MAPATPETESLRTVGVLGGMASPSTVEYYRGLNDGINRELGGHNAAEVLIRSVNFQRIEHCISTEQWEVAGELLADAARDLEAGGASFLIMATNTMHRVAPAITEAVSIPFVHIIDPTADAIREAGIDTVGVLGTSATMEMPFYRERFHDHDIDVIVPEPDQRQRVDEIIFSELVDDVVREDSREFYLDVMQSMLDSGAGGIVLGCTEIELLVDEDDFPNAPLFDTTELHVDRAVELCLEPIDTL